MPARNPIPLEGVLNCWNDPYDLPDILLAVSRSGRTGRLSFSNPEGNKTIYVKDGKIVFAESSSDDDGLGQYLLRNGEISLEDFTRVSKLVSPGKRLGALLVAEGVLEPKALVPAVVGQVRWIILGLFRRTETWYGFKKEQPSRKESITLDMPVAQLVLEGVQSVDSWRRISKGVGDLNSVYQVASATEVEWSRLNLESGPTELLAMLSEPMRVADVCAEASLDDFDACRYLWAFKSLEWIEPAEISVDAAAELAERAEMAELRATAVKAVVARPAPIPPAAAKPVPPTPAPALATTVMNVEPVPSIPQRLVETRISAVKAPPPLVPPPPAPPRNVRANLHQTQLAVDLQKPATPGPATTQPEVAPSPKPIANALHHTQLFLESHPAEASTTGEMMEAILDGSGDATSRSYEIDEAPSDEASEIPEPPSNSATQFFPVPSALPPPLPPPPPEEEDFFHGSPGFASLSLDYAASSPEELALPPDVQEVQEVREEPEEEVPLIEAAVVEEAAPVPPALATTRPSQPRGAAVPSGLEFFASSDPFRSGQSTDAKAPPPPPFATDDPLQFAETSVAASLPPRPRTEELDLDMGNFFSGNEKK